MNKLSVFHGVHFENWDPTTPDTRGIGNSETCQIEVCKRMAHRGWDVVSYAPVPWRGYREFDGVQWAHLDDADFSREGHWLLFRRPEDLDNFPNPHPTQKCYVVAQDESFGGRWNQERIAKADGVFALCESHRRSLEADDPALKGKVLLSSNGLKMDLLRAADKEGIERNPHRITWASSPDRGLLRLLKIFKRLREWVSDAELHCFYGFDNSKKLEALGPQFKQFRIMREKIEAALDQPGVFWHGRVSQPEITREWMKSGIICYPTIFRETGCVTHMEAMACGAIPVCSPVWALAEHALAGSLIPGDPEDPLVQSRFVSEIFRWMAKPDQWEPLRRDLATSARLAFSWDRAVDLYEAHLLGYDHHPMTHSQFNFQLKNCLGAESILNLGCADDPADLKQMGAVNVDLRSADPIFRKATKADILCDMRDLSALSGLQFERLVYGDCLEHFDPAAVPAILREGQRVLAPGGKIIITVPDDQRPVHVQHVTSDGSQQYAQGISAVHTHRVPRSMVHDWLKYAGLELETYEAIDCGHYINHGVVARRISAERKLA